MSDTGDGEKSAIERMAARQERNDRQRVVLTWVILIPILAFIALIVYLSVR